MTAPESATELLISLIQDTEFGDLPAEAVHDTKRLIADTVGCALGARRHDATAIAASVAMELGDGRGAQASIVGTGLKCSVAAAGSANMYFGNYLDADDTYLNFSHPAVAAVFPALAFAEGHQLDGRQLITAVALGFEVGCRAGLALEFMRLKPSGEIASVTGNLGWYGFCVAAAVGKTLNFDREQYDNALGLAAWTAPIGTGQFYTPVAQPGKHMLKYSPVMFQGMSGIMAALLAHKGFTGEHGIFDAPEAFWENFGVLGMNRERLTAGLGSQWQVSQTSLKPYACGRYAHPAVWLFNDLVARHDLNVEDIEQVTVSTFDRAANWLGAHYRLENTIDLQFSIPMAVAAAAYGSDLGPSWQSAETLADPRILSFAERVRVTGNPATAPVILEQSLAFGRFKNVPTEVCILAGGNEFVGSADSSWGDPWETSTRMTDDEVKDKYRIYADAALPAETNEKALDILFELEEVENVAAALMPLLTESPQQKTP
ncbi:MmgE/PrpD family protein [Mycobacterium sp. E2497]|uniref:MmgE/PrpD family protein n=1 Tax=Mycobacterium sp. E2497 TaxID=1834135 RepID=UPI0007FE9E87|nr:MmgE/PrpD family protein [Mycobacterium sp. E2497]OBI21189.1 hypothetical protein A5713_12760 [Mycobacterium sp. E2497]